MALGHAGAGKSPLILGSSAHQQMGADYLCIVAV
jgi:hypothetical protein